MAIKFQTIELMSIIYFTIIFVSVGILLTEINDRYIINKFIREDKNLQIQHNKSIFRHIIETIIILISLTVIIYYTKKILIGMPFFLDNVNRFDHKKTKEITTASVLGLSVFLFSTGLREKIRIVNERLNN